MAVRDWWGLLVRNPAFARLWVAESISLAGDWFSVVAISVLAVQRGGGEGALAVALTLVAHEVPMGLMRPIAGVLADRFDRRNLLVAVHVAQMFATLAMAERALAGDVPGLQVLVVLRSLAGGLDWPARAGALRRVVSADDLLAANALCGASWSAMFALGMALGGLVASFGAPLALALDSATFAVAAILLATLPRMPTRATSGLGEALARAGSDLREAVALARSDPDLLRAVAAKTPMAAAAGAGVVLLNLIADRASFAGTGALSLGLLQAMRGVGTGLGPLLVARFVPRGPGLLAAWRLASWVALAAIALLPVVEAGWALLLAAFVWGVGTGTNWMLSSAEIQRRAPDAAIGRLSGLDLLSVELAFGGSALLGGLVVEALGVPGSAAVVGVLLGLALWVAVEWAARRTAG